MRLFTTMKSLHNFLHWLLKDKCLMKGSRCIRKDLHDNYHANKENNSHLLRQFAYKTLE